MHDKAFVLLRPRSLMACTLTASSAMIVVVMALVLGSMLASTAGSQEIGFDKALLDPNLYSREGQYENGTYRVSESRSLLPLTLESGVTMAITPDATLFESHVIGSMYLRGKADVAWFVSYDPETFKVTKFAKALPTATSLSFTQSLYRGEWLHEGPNGTVVVEPAVDTHAEYDLPVSRYDFSAGQVGGSTGWGGQPLALLLGQGDITGVFWSSRIAGSSVSGWEYPGIIYDSNKFAEFSGGPFSDASLNPIGMTLVNSLSRLWGDPRPWTPEDSGVGLPLGFSYNTPFTTPGMFSADFDGDGRIDIHDFGTLKDHFGTNGGRSDGDANGDGWVDIDDFGVLKQNFGWKQPSAVPEPPTFGLLALGALLMRLVRPLRRSVGRS